MSYRHNFLVSSSDLPMRSRADRLEPNVSLLNVYDKNVKGFP